MSACSPIQIELIQPETETPNVQLLFPTNASDFTPATSTNTELPATDTAASPLAKATLGQTIIPTQPNLPAPTELPQQATPLPELPGAANAGDDTTAARPVFDTFVAKVKNGKANQIVGVYVENILALRVVQQPPNNPAYVSIRMGDATQFLLAFTYAGNTGLLAHNFLSGKLFFNLKEGDVVQIIYGDGNVTEYEVSKIESFQALKPESTTSDFLDLASGETLNATNLFYKVYGGDHHLTFQTCIAQDNNSEWGRLFVIANPL